MGTGYIRTDTINNIADGNIINASDFDAEYDAIEAAFNSSTGHTHDGTSSEGGPVTVLGPAQDFVASTTDIKPKINNTLDIGTTGLKFKDMYLAGTANLVNVTTTGDVTLTGAANNVVFDASDNALEFADSAKGVFGTGDDLQLYHDGTDSYIENNTGELYIQGDGITLRSDTDTETYITMDKDGAVALYYDNSKKFETTATGVAITGSLALDGIHLDDTEKLTFGNSASPDLEIFHNGSNSFISDTGTGSLVINGTQINIQNAANDAVLAEFIQAGAVNLYHNGNAKFATDADGVNVTGQIDVSTDVNLTTDGRAIKLGASEEVTLTHVHNVGVLLDVENATTNGVTDVLKLQAKSTGTPAVGIGVGVEFSTETAASTIETGGVIESVATGLTPASEEFDMVFKTMSAGATAAERLKLNGSGATIGNINVDGNTIISTDTNGNINLTPNGAGEVNISKVDIDAGAIDGVSIGANSAITELQVDNLNLNGNAITSTDTDGNITLTPNGAGEVDITKVDIAGGEIDGTTIGANSAAAGTFTNLTASTDLTLASGATVTAILDEDTMSSDSDTAIATQQSIKAYVNGQIGAASNVTDTGITFDGSTTGDSITTTLAITDPTANRTFTFADESGTVAVRSYVDNQANASAVALAIALG
jgi:hypothetical protein